MMRPKEADKMVDVGKDYRTRNTVRVNRLRQSGHWLRLEFDRHTDLPLVTLCLNKSRPPHVHKVHPGIYAVDLPADVFKTVWMIEGGFAVATYRTKLDREADL